MKSEDIKVTIVTPLTKEEADKIIKNLENYIKMKNSIKKEVKKDE